MASPSMTLTNSPTSIGTIAASTAATPFTVDVSAKFEAQVQIVVVFGTVAATSGLQVQCFRKIGTSVVIDTNAAVQFTIPSVGSTTSKQSFALPTGRWSVTLTNLDGTNSVTSVTWNTDTIDSIA